MYASVVNVAAQGKMLKQVCWIAYSFSFKIIFLLMSTNWPLKELAFFFFFEACIVLYCFSDLLLSLTALSTSVLTNSKRSHGGL